MALPAGIICSSEDYQRSLHDRSIYCLLRSDTIGVLLTVEAGFVSLIAIAYVFGLIGRNVWWRFRHMPTTRLRVFHQPMDLLMFSLLLADSVQAIGAVLSLKWVVDGKTTVGTSCTAQAVIKLVGANAVAFSTTGITIFTFIGIWMQRTISSMRGTLVAVVGIWIICASIPIVALSTHQHSEPIFITPTPYWCWIGSHFVVWRFLSEYIWMWAALLFSVLCYIPLYLWMRGNIEINTHAWWKVRFKWSSERDRQLVAMRRRSLTMLAYPLVYSISILPLSVVRSTVYAQEARFGASHVPPAATFIAVTIFAISGFFNVILLLTTRRTSGLFGDLMFTAPSRAPIIFFRNEREPRGEIEGLRSQSKPGSRIYEEVYPVHAI